MGIASSTDEPPSKEGKWPFFPLTKWGEGRSLWNCPPGPSCGGMSRTEVAHGRPDRVTTLRGSQPASRDDSKLPFFERRINARTEFLLKLLKKTFFATWKRLQTFKTFCCFCKLCKSCGRAFGPLQTILSTWSCGSYVFSGARQKKFCNGSKWNALHGPSRGEPTLLTTPWLFTGRYERFVALPPSTNLFLEALSGLLALKDCVALCLALKVCVTLCLALKDSINEPNEVRMSTELVIFEAEEKTAAVLKMVLWLVGWLLIGWLVVGWLFFFREVRSPILTFPVALNNHSAHFFCTKRTNQPFKSNKETYQVEST